MKFGFNVLVDDKVYNRFTDAIITCGDAFEKTCDAICVIDSLNCLPSSRTVIFTKKQTLVQSIIKSKNLLDIKLHSSFNKPNWVCYCARNKTSCPSRDHMNVGRVRCHSIVGIAKCFDLRISTKIDGTVFGQNQ